MILHALYKYYETLLDDPNSDVCEPGYSKAGVGHCLVLSKDGQLLDVVDLRGQGNKNKLVSREMIVPEQLKRSSGVAANFMCDHCMYILAMGRKKGDDKQARIAECFNDFVQLHEQILASIENEDEGAAALLMFLRGWDINAAAQHPVVTSYFDDLSEGNNIVFTLEGVGGYLHERKKIKEAWAKYRSSKFSGVVMQCLVTGQTTEVARLHANIKGVIGAQSSGASLVSFNNDAFLSYGKTQSYNAPVGEEAAFGYATALNYLLNSEKHRIRIGDTTTVFWAKRSSNGLEESLLSALFFPIPEDDNSKNKNETNKDNDKYKRVRDPQTVTLIRDILNKVKTGKPVSENSDQVNLDTNFYILGLSPNASRLAVRYWHVDKFGALLQKLLQHHRDLMMVKRYATEPDFISISMILRETAPLNDAKNIPPLLSGILMRSILTGASYPMALYNAIISRIRADQEVNYVRAATIKACLARNWRLNKRNEVDFTVALNEQNHNTGYLLGRLFALLEKVQADANPGVEATIRDRYFGAASATPGSVFPILLRLAQHHIAKAEYGSYTDKRIEEVISFIDNFPTHLSLEDQGQFIIGYYQQRQALYQKSKQKESAN